VTDLVELARIRNGRLGVTGAIIFTGSFFAQLIEGLTNPIDELWISIGKDPRHSGIRVVNRMEVQDRYFSGWTMAYSGPSTYMNKHIEPLVTQALEPSENARRGRRLTTLMRELTARRN
jgi:hypothetical protein